MNTTTAERSETSLGDSLSEDSSLGGSTQRDSAPKNPIILGQIGLSFYRIAGAVVQQMLEDLGHSVRVVEGSHGDIFPQLARGDVDLLSAAWLPHAHGDYWAEYGGEADELATLYEGARLFWAVPAYVPETEVASIADLARPEVARRMRPEILGVGPGSGLEQGSEQAMEAYGLAAAGYSYRTAEAEAWSGVLTEAAQDSAWVAVPAWTPLWLDEAYGLRALGDPEGVFGGEDRAVLVARKGFAEALPKRTAAVLRRLHIGRDAVAEMDAAVNTGGQTPQDAAQDWMEAHSSQVQRWLGAGSL